MIREFIALFQSEMYANIWSTLLEWLPVLLPILAVFIWWDLWLNYKRRKFIKDQGSVLLEIKIPSEMSKSPAAMEAFLTSIHEPVGASNLLKAYIDGVVRPWFSLEMVSIGGNVQFYIWMRQSFKSIVETQLYAQFPGIEVHEVPDYSLAVHHDPEKVKFGVFAQLALSKADAYPIRTYIDYGLDKDPDEEYKIDPLVPLLEFLGSLKRGEQAWVQILIQAHTKEGLNYGRLFTKPDWKKEANEEIKTFIKENAPTSEGDNKEPTVRDLTKDGQEVVYSMERNIGKWAYDTMIRITYFSEPDVHNPANIGGIIRSFKQFSSAGLNGFKPDWGTSFKYPTWQDFRDMRKTSNERKILEAYKRRSFFNPPFKNFGGKPFILTTEELATLFHFPSSMVATTPTLSRIPSKRSEAPSNLPV
jgi:hypothetical protein